MHAQNVRMLLAGATDVEINGETDSIPLTALSRAMGKIAKRLEANSEEMAATTNDQVEAYVNRIESTIALMWSDKVLQLARRAAPTMSARGELMYEHSIPERTPKKKQRQEAGGDAEGMGMGTPVGGMHASAREGGAQRERGAQGTKRAARETVELLSLIHI